MQPIHDDMQPIQDDRLTQLGEQMSLHPMKASCPLLSEKWWQDDSLNLFLLELVYTIFLLLIYLIMK